MNHPDVRRVIDFGEQVALLLVAIVHFGTIAEKSAQVVATLRDALPERQLPGAPARHG
ncbi:SAM-dependent methyltransferase [Streptomyces sp. 2A115]|uniref:SAM-dependent methyltransferase n=1 Tax=Streptomyces sp. 2A115 TaxID=3457439 RepID=UPI003FD543D3